jgi:hypothetical protein
MRPGDKYWRAKHQNVPSATRSPTAETATFDITAI